MIRLAQAGVRWEVQPDFAPLLEAVLNAPANSVKTSHVKRVTMHQVAGRSYFVKRYLHRGVALRPLKFFFKASQARQEWKLAQRLEQLGVPLVRHVALGERWGFGLLESTLITEGFDGQPLDAAPAVDLQAVLAFVARLHECGVLQRDLHPGNILLAPKSGELRLVDIHGTVIKPALTPEERAANLAFLRVFLPIPVEPEIAALSARQRRDYFALRSRRCLRHNREFASRRFGGLPWHVRLPFLNAASEAILRDPDGFLATRATILKPGRSSTVGRADGLVLKRYNLRKPGNLLKDLFRPSKARRAYRKAYHLELVGVATARPIAVADRRRLGFVARSYLLMEEIPDARHLGQSQGDGHCAARELGDLLAKLHNEGFSHRDLKETNLVFDSVGRGLLIDLEGLEFVGVLPLRRAVADLTRLARAARKLPQFTPAHWQTFLRRYCRGRGIRPRELAE